MPVGCKMLTQGQAAILLQKLGSYRGETFSLGAAQRHLVGCALKSQSDEA